MEKQKYRTDPVTKAKAAFIIVLIALGIFVSCLIVSFAEKCFGANHFIFRLLGLFFRPLILLMIISPVACFLCGLSAIFGLLKTKEKTKKPYLQALVSVAFGVIIFGIVIFEILSAYGEAVAHGQRLICHNNQRIIAHSFYSYHLDNDSWPVKDLWCNLIKSDNDLESEAFQCPNDEIGPCSYAMNEAIPADANELPDDLVLLFESAPGWNKTGGPADVVTDRHGKPGANIAFADGHVEFVKSEDIPNLRWTVEEE